MAFRAIGRGQGASTPWQSLALALAPPDTSIDGKFTNNFVAPPIFTDVLSEKLSNSFSRDIYARVGMHLTVDIVNFVTPQFVDLGFSTIDALDKGAGLCTYAARVGRPVYVPIGEC